MKRMLCTLLLVSTVSAMAATPDLSKDTKSIDIEGNFDPEKGGETTYYLTLALGYFFIDNAEGRIYVGHEYDSGQNRHYSLGIGGYYNFARESAWVPYAGVRGGWHYSDFDSPDLDSRDSWFISPRAGVKYFLAENVAIYAHYYFLWNSEPIYNNDGENLDDTDMGVHLGLSVYFK